MEIIKDCPFCGCKAEYSQERVEYEDVYIIECSNCPATMKSIYLSKIVQWWNMRFV